MTILTLNLDTVHLTDEQFYELCQNNRELQFERTSRGELIIMPPVGGESGNREADIIIDLGVWNRQTGLGYIFSSSTVFKLPNGANRSPDAAWIQKKRWEALTPEQRRKFPPIAPDFVVELRSATDDLELLRDKMREYIDAGVQLGWLINPQQQQVEIYRPGVDVEVQNLPTKLRGENLLPGFSLSLSSYLYG
ncbi:Uma2 family endonuclease (plasmid) [Brasilonema octagenarum UFV-E1]|uniref:Uma2 family endonuclease n=2 Tax=Brasilonema TaxID=383614 RepID=A0A856MQE3_9CYAN|nr:MULTISPECIES: Uma2 family endonuclease [Brasilonema]NMF62520.1 Uma2 family endonuclease [Brasilonema octagenarum UFV-OR1]QDL12772.1 Uma2 family endonuclease [Brasilonema sennae CENA114]QDL19168.1 Uma2 family endonuclease [Brasilonema octagenarum UFV-E1]